MLMEPDLQMLTKPLDYQLLTLSNSVVECPFRHEEHLASGPFFEVSFHVQVMCLVTEAQSMELIGERTHSGLISWLHCAMNSWRRDAGYYVIIDGLIPHGHTTSYFGHDVVDILCRVTPLTTCMIHYVFFFFSSMDFHLQLHQTSANNQLRSQPDDSSVGIEISEMEKILNSLRST